VEADFVIKLLATKPSGPLLKATLTNLPVKPLQVTFVAPTLFTVAVAPFFTEENTFPQVEFTRTFKVEFEMLATRTLSPALKVSLLAAFATKLPFEKRNIPPRAKENTERIAKERIANFEENSFEESLLVII